jgi:hypothetical protein
MMTSNVLQYSAVQMALMSRSDKKLRTIWGSNYNFNNFFVLLLEKLFYSEFPKHSLLSEMTIHSSSNTLILLTT